MSKLKGKIALITGGSTGIGFASAKRFIEEGAFVFISGRREEELEKAVAKLGPNARAIRADISDLSSLDNLFEEIKKEKRDLDVLFANAGVGLMGSLSEITLEQFDYTFNINVKGTLFTVQKALPLLKSGSSIILTGSTVGVMGTPDMSVYSASKAAVRNLARSWAQDLRGSGIRVNVLSPGATNTEKVSELVGEEVLKSLAKAAPLERIGDPSETAAVATFLASDDSSFMTGSEVFVDGGLAQI